MKSLSFCVLLTLFMAPRLIHAANCDGAGNCYVRAGATGTGNGSSWTNAYTGFGSGAGQVSPASMTRGVTYWIAAGSYGNVTFSAPVSGTSIITIEAATSSNHGPATDWNSSYAGQAAFGASSIATNYWTFNGQAWPSACSQVIACDTTGYNIYFRNTSTSGSSSALLIQGANYLTVEYVEVQGSTQSYNSSGTSGSDDTINVGGSTSGQCSGNDYWGYDYVHDAGTDLMAYNNGACSAYGNVTVEHTAFKNNCTAGAERSGSTTYNHCQGIIMLNGGQFIARYNEFRNIGSSGVITTASPGAPAVSNWYIYGNSIYWDNAFISGGGAGASQAIGFADGFIGLFGESFSGVLQIYNNTWANMNFSGGCAVGSCSWLFICGSSCGSSGSVNATIYNNIWWQSGKYQDYVLDSASSWTPTADYNEGFCPTSGCINSGYSTQGSHDTLSNTGNPFTNFDGTNNFSISLVADTAAGYSLNNASATPSGCIAGTNCENTDGLGITRGANGTMDRGALQISSSIKPDPPTNVNAVAH